MAKKSSGIQATINSLPKWVRVLFALPVIDGIVYGLLYRFCAGIGKKSVLLIIVGFLWWWLGMAVLWIVDLICVIIKGRPIFIV